MDLRGNVPFRPKMSVVSEFRRLVLFLCFLYLSLSLTVTWEGHSSDKRPLVIVDDILSRDSIKGIRGYLLQQQWIFSITNDFYTFDSNSFLNNSDHGNYTNAPWQCKLPTAAFRNSNSWQAMNGFLTKKQGKEFRPTEVRGYIVQRGDFSLYNSRCADIDDYRVVVFLNDFWQKNGYGHLTIHDELGRMHAAHPRYGRVVFVPCDLSFVMKPPAMQSSQTIHTLVVMATPHMTSEEVEGDEPKTGDLSESELLKMEQDLLNYFPGQNVDHREIDVEKHITRRFSLRDGRTITVLDNVFTPSEVLDLTDFLAKYCTYTDSSPEDQTDNVRWITGFSIDVFTTSHFWRASRQIVSHVSASDGFYPYDVALNLIRMADHTMIHQDCEYGSDEFTLLIYLNEGWEVNSFGETAFFDDNFEPFIAVKPAYGRVVVFPCSIHHSARPPNARINGARYSFAVKMSPSLRTASDRELDRDKNDVFDLVKELADFLSSEEIAEILQALNDAEKEDDDGYTIPKLLVKLERKKSERFLSYI